MAQIRSIVTAGVICIAIAAQAHAQVIRVAGTVRDETGRPVRGASIVAENPDQTPPRLTATSNDKGQFGFIGIRRGSWTLAVEATGFEPIRFTRQVTSGRQEPIDVRLARTATPVALPLSGVNAADIQRRIERAESLASGGDLDGSIAAWRDVMSRVPALTSVHLQLGLLYERKSDPERARAEYRQLLAAEPENVRAQAALSRLARD